LWIEAWIDGEHGEEAPADQRRADEKDERQRHPSPATSMSDKRARPRPAEPRASSESRPWQVLARGREAGHHADDDADDQAQAEREGERRPRRRRGPSATASSTS